MGGLRTRKHTNVKVIMGLLCPFYIARLEFKSKEELQLMPQTEEEHLYGLEDDNDNDSVENGTTHNPQHRNTEADVEGDTYRYHVRIYVSLALSTPSVLGEILNLNLFLDINSLYLI
ncbi:transient receptor potential cation channel trpm-like isoform X2 [Diaphorina citri]|uniref:Transient receptor potential cation channel trpm-like isoform X2 n=1 Tax=Diaphorina citri TaxID=121845 RepID=A0A3Q0J7W7_DIACI|nr:transient receptor potential cation channel trpm-like isoform X2 [Diaphorina citri]